MPLSFSSGYPPSQSSRSIWLVRWCFPAPLRYPRGTDPLGNRRRCLLSENSGSNGEDLYVVRSPTLASMQPVNVSNAVILSAAGPSSVVANGESLTLTISGSNFNDRSVVLWNGFLIPTGYIAATQLVATVPAEYLTQEGTALERNHD